MASSDAGRARIFWPVVITVVLSDIVTKWIAVRDLYPRGVPREVFGEVVRLTLVYNRGAAFGLHLGQYSRWIFLGLTIAALVILAQLYRQTTARDIARTLAIALKMAQAEYVTGIHGTPPVLLIDDVMGELDVKRRSGLLPLLERAHHAHGQVFMTCTEENWPRELGRDLQRWQVEAGTIHRVSS